MAAVNDRRTDLVISICLFIFVFAGYTSISSVIQRADSRWTIHLALSMLHARNTDLDEFIDVLDTDDYRVKEYDGHLYSAYPIGTSVAILPAIAIIDAVASRVGGESLYDRFRRPAHDTIADPLEIVLGSAITALTAVVIYSIGRSALSRSRAGLLALIFAFATPAWSTGSRALWQHDLSMLLLASTLLIFLRAGTQEKSVQFTGLLLAAAYVVRPTNSIPILCFSLLVLVVYRRYFVPYLLWAALIAAPFLFYNYKTFGAILQPYYLPSASNAAWNSFASGLAGTVVSPNRGLFTFSPILLFSFLGLYLKLRRHEINSLDITLLSIITLHWLMLGSWLIWWGGHAYGPRLFTDMLPFLIYFMIPAIEVIRIPQHPAEAIYLGLFTGALFVSVLIHYRGVSDRDTWEWNAEVAYMIPAVNEQRSWDWSDLQVMRGLRPAKLRVSPVTVGAAADVDSGAVRTLQFWVENWGDQPIGWEVVTPIGVNLAIEEHPTDFHHYRAVEPLEPLTRSRIRAKVDLRGWPIGSHSLGGILLRPVSDAGSPAEVRPLVIPISIRITETDPSNAIRAYLPFVAKGSPTSMQPGYAKPPDIQVNGTRQTTQGNTLQALFGSGWYPVERAGDASWRWAQATAQLYLHSPIKQPVTMSIEAAALFSGDLGAPYAESGGLMLKVADGERTELTAKIGRPAVAAFTLEPGWTVITITSPAGDFRPIDADPATGDARMLSFALASIDLATEATRRQLPTQDDGPSPIRQ